VGPVVSNDRVKQAIAEGQTERLERLKLDADEAMRLNAEIPRFDPIALQDEARSVTSRRFFGRVA
jgi:hypothetical protein